MNIEPEVLEDARKFAQQRANEFCADQALVIRGEIVAVTSKVYADANNEKPLEIVRPCAGGE